MSLQTIIDFLEPVSIAQLSNDEGFRDTQLGRHIAVCVEVSPDIDHADLVLVGCGEMRGAGIQYTHTDAPDAIRNEYYKLFHWHTDVNVADIGNVKCGATLQDSYAALRMVVNELIALNKKVVILGGSHDVAEARILRVAFPDMRLQVGANSAYSLENADRLQPLDELDLLLIEQPLAEDDLWDHSRLQAMHTTPICLDESILSAHHARQALEMGACRVINIKAGRVGGLSEAVAIHDLCSSRGVPVWCGGMLETGVGRAANLALASLAGFILPGDISASDRYYAQDITYERFRLNPDSTIRVPDAPGLGVTIDPQALERFTIDRLVIGGDEGNY